MPRGGHNKSWGYPMRYRDIISGEIVQERTTRRNGKIIYHHVEYFVNDAWLKRDEVPESREWRRKNNSSEKGFLMRMKRKIKEKNKLWEEQGKFIVGENEFDEEKGKCEKLTSAFHKQVQIYGDRCPITLIKFTTIRNNHSIKDEGRPVKLFSNVSPDRLLNHINYTQQNILFTSWGWNQMKGAWSIKDLRYLIQPDVIERYKKILIERFPDQKYET